MADDDKDRIDDEDLDLIDDDDGDDDLADLDDLDDDLDDDLGDDFGEGLGDELGDGPGIGDVMLALADYGIVLPEDTDDANFMDRLRTALIAKSGSEPAAGDGQEFPDTFDQTNDTIVADPQIATMSAEGQYAARAYRQNLHRQLKKLLDTGRCSPAEFRQQRACLKAVRLSLANGKPKTNRLTDWIQSRKDLPPGAVWSPQEKLKRMAAKSVAVDHPPDRTMKQNDQELQGEELDAAVDDFFKG